MNRPMGLLAARLKQQDKNPASPDSTGCAMSLSLLCKTLTNSSALRLPSWFESNKWKMISTTLSLSETPQTWYLNRYHVPKKIDFKWSEGGYTFEGCKTPRRAEKHNQRHHGKKKKLENKQVDMGLNLPTLRTRKEGYFSMRMELMAPQFSR
jgi:hypothetical protein